MNLPEARGGAAAFARAFRDHVGAGGAVVLAASVVATLCEGAGLLLLAPLLALVAGPVGGGLGGRLGELFRPLMSGEGTAPVAGVVAVMTALLVLRALIIRFRDRQLARLLVGFVEALRARLVVALAFASWPSLARLNHARLTQLLGADLQRCGAAAQFLVQGLTTAILLTVQFGAALILSPGLTAVAAGLTAAAALLLWPLTGGAGRLGKVLTEDNMALAERTARFLGGLKFALVHNQEADIRAMTGDASRSLADHQIAFQDQQSRTRIAMSTASAALAGAVLLVGHLAFHTPAPVLLALMALFTRIVGPAAQLQQTFQLFTHALPAWIAVQTAESDLTPATTSTWSDPPPFSPAPPLSGPIVFTDVTFAYTPESPVLGPLNLRIDPGAVTGLAGPSGSGKTTVADLLTGLLTPSQGGISIEGRPLDPDRLRAWRDRLAYAPQDGVLFNGTVEANLLWGVGGASEPDTWSVLAGDIVMFQDVSAANVVWGTGMASEADLWTALATVGMETLIHSLPERLMTVVGERGVRFSGGERQRLGLARALLRRPSLLILDEATSALPPDNERDVLQAILKAQPGLTVLLISHRPETLALCDRVYRLENGRLAAI